MSQRAVREIAQTLLALNGIAIHLGAALSPRQHTNAGMLLLQKRCSKSPRS